ncbi:calcium-binding protein [Acuticoccus kandeliae]|uniref:calcium-binding protein n=1 Tax=Acuticoccus kandeliae TaxID=2073160 RepID=UPI002481AC16|nr:calcium-binding protein [Acuticoccus kandeliae]
MAIKVTLHGSGKKGVNYDAFLDSYIDNFVSSGYPYFEEGDEMLIVGAVDGADTDVIVLGGANFAYDLGSHTVSGKLSSAILGTLGDSYNNDGSFDLDGQGHLTGYTKVVEFEGLKAANNSSTRGEFHEIVAELMYLGGTNSRGAETFFEEINSQGHIVTGSNGADTYSGTEFRDVIKGGNGNDKLNGKDGNDKILGGNGNDLLNGGDGKDVLNGGAGNDKLIGGEGADKLFGGDGNDIFIYKSVEDSNKSGRDTIMDFNADGNDRINLRAIDADTTTGGNQKFDFIEDDRFSGTAGELRYQEKGNNTILMGDVDGDGKADLYITLKGFTDLDAGDLIF